MSTKLVYIIYHSEYADEIKAIAMRCGVREYVEAPKVWGMDASGPHMGTHVWPGTDSLMLLPLPREKAMQLLEALRVWKGAERDRAHVRAIVSPVEQLL